MKPIPYGKQDITDEDIQAVAEVLRSEYLTQGPKIAEFEKAFAAYVGSKYAVAVSNGTAALHLSAMVLNVRPGQKVITTPITFAATANCIRYCGGDIVFADIDRETYLLDISKVRELLHASPKGTYAGIIPVDFAGNPVNMELFRELADEHNLWIIEDACHAPGGWFLDSKGVNQMCGNGKYADLAIFSFHPVKHIASGEGGMITTDDPELYNKLLMLRTHGITKDPNQFVNHPSIANGLQENNWAGIQSYPGWYMEMQELGYNYRLTDFQAALGLAQLQRAEAGLKRREEIAKRYKNALNERPGSIRINGTCLSNGHHAYHLFIVEAENRRGLYEYLKEFNIFTQVHYIPLHLMPYYRKYGWKMGDMPQAEDYYSGCLSLPMYPSMSDLEIDYIAEKLIAFEG